MMMRPLRTGSWQLSALERIYAALSPCVFGPSLLAAYFAGASTDELRERTGRMPPAQARAVWLHGASAGEMAAAARLVAMLHQHGYCFPAVFTAANRAGVAYITRSGGPDTLTALAPWDVRGWLSRAFDRWNPAVLLLIETELWPLMVFEAHRRGVPVLALSARIYPKDVPRYRAIRGFIGHTLGRMSRILAQNETARGRFIELGAAANSCVAAGNLKYLRERDARDDSGLRDELGLRPAERLIVFGSVHHREIAPVLNAIAALDIPDVRFVIAPRHLSSAQSIAREAKARGFEVVRRSAPWTADWGILILDTMGELRDFYCVGSVAVIGGGFGRFGGHNPLEALEAGAPVLFGPHFDHFEHEAHALITVTPEAMVAGPGQIAARLKSWLGDEDARRRALFAQQSTMPDTAVVTRRYLDELSPYLDAINA
jgi:3-deoxy-D-manno-octulosonic-acid transferase